MYYEHTVRLSGMDVDGRGVCKASALLNHLQNAATLAAEDGGFSREMLIERYGAFWMLARSWYRLERPLCWEDEITIRTWHRGGKRAMMYRDYDIYVGGELVGESVSAWVLAGVEDRKLLRLSQMRELEGTEGGGLCKQLTLSKLRMPGEMEERDRRRMGYSDTDINGHVNNVHYADFACDALHLERYGRGKFVRTVQIDYVGECHAGETVTIDTAVQGDELFARGRGQGGDERFGVCLALDKLP